MSEVTKPSAVTTSSTLQSKTTSAKVSESPTKIADEMNKNNTKSNSVPKKPEPKRITVTVGEGSSIGALAVQYNTTVADIVKINPGLNPDRVRAGAQIKIDAIDTKELKAYNDYQTALENQKWEAEQAKKKEERISTAQSKVEKAKQDGWGEDYSFSIDKEGYVHVKLKSGKKLAEIREDLGLSPGSLDSMNNFENRYGEIPVINDGEREIETWDNYKAKEGESFTINTFDMNTERTWTQAFKDTWKSITKFFK